MRETLTWCSGRTSYWVTTGPGVDGHDLGRDREVAGASPRSAAMFDSWSTPCPGRAGAARGSSRSTDGRVQAIELQRLEGGRRRGGRGRDPASATLPTPAASPGTPAETRAAAAGCAAVERTGPDGLADRRLVRRGAGSSRMLRRGRRLVGGAHRDGDRRLGRHRRRAALPRRSVGRRLARSRRPAPSSAATHRGRPSVDPTHRAAPVNGAMSSRSCRLNASISPRSRSPRAARTCPGPVSSGSSVPARNRPMRPPPRSVSKQFDPEDLERAQRRDVRDGRARRASSPSPSPGACPGPRRRTSRRRAAGTGSSQRPVSNHGAIESRHQSVSAPWPGSIERDQRDRAERHHRGPDDRADDLGREDLGDVPPDASRVAAARAALELAARGRVRRACGHG